MLSMSELAHGDGSGDRVSMLRVRRATRPWGDRVRKYRVSVDGEPVASLGWAQTIELPVEPGVHTLRVAIGRAGSPVVDFRVNENDRISFVCRLGHSWALAALHGLYSRVEPNSWLVLEYE